MPDSESTDQLLRAILALLIDERESRGIEPPTQRTEVLLANAGLGATEIAQLTGKQPAAIRMALSRARAKKAKGKAE